MESSKSKAARRAAQELVYDAMEADDEKTVVALCRRALEIYPDCADAIIQLAEIESVYVRDVIEAGRRAVEAGRRDLGPQYFRQNRGVFWLDVDTRPFMRAMAMLADALRQWGQPEGINEAIAIYEEMLQLNPNDNQGVRDPLAGCYLQARRYDAAADLLERYEGDGMAVPRWARVLLAYVTQPMSTAVKLLKLAREQNPHVEQYLTGQKRRPRARSDYYSLGEESEAIFCVDTLWEAWKKHPAARQWLQQQGRMDGDASSAPGQASG
ncbi:MAG TPA: tetratricopeptide repeat protein [Tepidisphaeraceae bacterium]|nr:tetratricopeptide repeat protein [Tepidisphaeraceae bacterium]